MDDRNHGDKDLKDCIWGKKWLQSQEYIDAENIGIIGGKLRGVHDNGRHDLSPGGIQSGC